MQHPPQMQPVRNTMFYLDGCRASFMLLGIVLHSTIPFMTNMKWYITAPQQSTVLSYLYYLINAFRMPGFFLIAGFFSALMLTKRFSGPWFQTRLERLGIPLLFGVLFIVPFESLTVAAHQHLESGSLHLRDLIVDAAHRHNESALHWVSHLWFLIDLLLISAIFALVWPSVRTFAVRLARRFVDMSDAGRALAGPSALALLAGYLLAVEVFAYSRIGSYFSVGGDAPMWGVVDAWRMLHYAPFFLIGALLFEDMTLLERFRMPPATVWLVALLALFAAIAIQVHVPRFGRLGTALGGVAAVLLIRIWLQVAFQTINRPSRLVRHGVESAYTVYLVHHPIILMMSALAIWLSLGPALGFFFVLTATTVLSFAVYFATRDIPLAAFLLNGVRKPRKTHAIAPSGTTAMDGP